MLLLVTCIQSSGAVRLFQCQLCHKCCSYIQVCKKYMIFIKTTLALYGLWNFDFFRTFYSDICLGIGFLPTLALDYVIAVCPLLLMAITYLLVKLYDKNYRVIVIMWNPFRAIFFLFKENFDVRTSMIDSCVTFFY